MTKWFCQRPGCDKPTGRKRNRYCCRACCDQAKTKPKPNCLHCNTPVPRAGQKYCCNACVPSSVRAVQGRAGRLSWMRTQRKIRYGKYLRRLEGRVTAQDLLAVFAAVEAEAYGRGYSACRDREMKKLRRQMQRVA